MIVIGINGRPGSGKTTISEAILNDKNKKVIHLDSIFNNIKQTYFKKQLKVLEKKTGEVEPYIDNTSNIGKLTQLKQIRFLIEIIKEAYAKFYIKEFIEKNNSNIDYLVLEGRYLDSYHLENFCDKLYFIQTEDELRYQRMKERTLSGLSKTDMDSIFQNDLKTTINLEKYTVINNNTESILEIVEEINNNIERKSFSI